MSHLSLSLFGGFEARLGDISLAGFSTDKVRLLLAYLAVERSHPHRRETLAGLLWPGYPERSARTSLRHALANLRKVLDDTHNEPPFLLVEGEIIQLNPQAQIWVDALRFQNLVSGSDEENQLAALEEAAGLIKGAFLDGFSLADSPEFESWVRGMRLSLQEQAVLASMELANRYEAQAELGQAVQALRRALAIEPWREEAHRELMRLLAKDGQRSAALAQYAACQQELRAGLGVEPSAETVQLYEHIRSGEAQKVAVPIVGESRKPIHNLPRQLTSFIGRETEIEQVKTLLKQNALVSLVGPGGVGKTRTALRVAEDVLEDFNDGVWLVELVTLSDPKMVTPTTARAVGMYLDTGSQALDALVGYSRSRQFLLLLDNCEHLLDACAKLAEVILSSCPQVKILTTSREMLAVPGEIVWTLAPLPIPCYEDRAELLSFNESVRLFVDRVAKTQPSFTLSQRTAQAVGQVCAQVDGIPLAIELAAAWVRTLSVEQINTRIRESLDYLRGASRTALPRHQTMRGCLDWSYDLLTPPEQNLLLALSVFAGSWTLEAAEAVCFESWADSVDVLKLLDQLVQKSLVVATHDPEIETRYRLLEPVRQYAVEKLYDSGRAEATRDRHLAYYQGLAEQAKPHLRAHRQVEWLQRLEQEMGNNRQALEWSCSEDGSMERIEHGLRMAADLGIFWISRMRFVEGAQWLERLLNLEKTRRGKQPVSSTMQLPRAWGLAIIVWLKLRILNTDQVLKEHKLEESIALFQDSGETGRSGIHFVKFIQASVAEKITARAQWQEIYIEAEALNDKYLAAESLKTLSEIARQDEDPALAGEYLQRSLAVSQEAGDMVMVIFLHMISAERSFLESNWQKARLLAVEARSELQKYEAVILDLSRYGYRKLGELAWRMGDYDQAEQDFTQSIKFAEAYQSIRITERLWLPGVAASRGDYAKARDLLNDYFDRYEREYFLWTDGVGMYMLGELDWALQDHSQARCRFMELNRVTEEPSVFTSMAALGLAKVAFSQGQVVEAGKHLCTALMLQLKDPFYGNVVEDHYAATILAAILAISQQRYKSAARLFGAADSTYQRNRLTYPLFRREIIDKAITETRAAVDDDLFNNVWNEGKSMDFEQALRHALELIGPS